MHAWDVFFIRYLEVATSDKASLIVLTDDELASIESIAVIRGC